MNEKLSCEVSSSSMSQNQDILMDELTVLKEKGIDRDLIRETEIEDLAAMVTAYAINYRTKKVEIYADIRSK